MMIILEIIGGVFLLGALLYGISNFLARLELKKVTIDDESIKNFSNRYGVGAEGIDTPANDNKKDIE